MATQAYTLPRASVRLSLVSRSLAWLRVTTRHSLPHGPAQACPICGRTDLFEFDGVEVCNDCDLTYR